MTEGESKLLVKSGDNHDGVAAWGRMHAKFKRRTITRLMRMQKACMYPKEAKLEEMATAVLAWEEKWKKMLAEYPDVKIPELWKMAAMHMLCPKEIKDVLDVYWDEIGEDYEKMKAKVVAWATNRAEKKGGAVPMEIGMAEEDTWEQYWREEDEWWFEEGPTQAPINAVSPNTQCHNCGLQGHIAKGCTAKGKGKGANAANGGKKGKGKGGEKGWNQEGWNEKGWNNKGGKKGEKGGGTGSWGKGYHGQCYRCGQIGHKA